MSASDELLKKIAAMGKDFDPSVTDDATALRALAIIVVNQKQRTTLLINMIEALQQALAEHNKLFGLNRIRLEMLSDEIEGLKLREKNR